MPKATKDFAVERKKLSDLTPDKRNANRGTERGSKAIAQSLKDYGAGRSILLDKHGNIIAGNKTAENAAKAGLGEDVLVVKTDGTKIVAVQRMDLDLAKDKRAKGLAIADNRAGELSLDWDPAVLASFESEIDLTTYFTPAELAAILPAKELLTDEDEVPEPPKTPVTKRGDLWILGDHRLLCGDSTVEADVRRLCKESVSICLTDPPYGLGTKKASGKNDYGAYDDSLENLTKMAALWLPIARSICSAVVFSPGVTNAWLYPQADWIICWFYGGGQLRSPWGFNCWQPFLCYGKDPSLTSGHGGRPDAVDMNTPANSSDLNHPCPKPVALWEWLIARLSFSVGEIIYDPFAGAGTGIVAAQKQRRKCFAMEIDPIYCDVIVERWQNATGKKAVLDGAA